MMEILAVTLAFAAGATLAWLVRGTQHKMALALLQAQLTSVQQQCAERGNEIDALRREHAGVPRAIELVRRLQA